MTDIPNDFVSRRTGSPLLDELVTRHDEITRRLVARKQPQQLLSSVIPKPEEPASLPIFPPLPSQNIKPIKDRIAETEAFRNKVSKGSLQSMRNAIWGSARDLQESVDSPLLVKPQPRIQEIQGLVASHFGISFIDIRSLRRTKNIILPRHIAMYLCKLLTLHSFPEIGRRFGRDHSTVLHAVRKITGLVETDTALADEIAVLKNTILNL